MTVVGIDFLKHQEQARTNRRNEELKDKQLDETERANRKREYQTEIQMIETERAHRQDELLRSTSLDIESRKADASIKQADAAWLNANVNSDKLDETKSWNDYMRTYQNTQQAIDRAYKESTAQSQQRSSYGSLLPTNTEGNIARLNIADREKDGYTSGMLQANNAIGSWVETILKNVKVGVSLQ